MSHRIPGVRTCDCCSVAGILLVAIPVSLFANLLLYFRLGIESIVVPWAQSSGG